MSYLGAYSALCPSEMVLTLLRSLRLSAFCLRCIVTVVSSSANKCRDSLRWCRRSSSYRCFSPRFNIHWWFLPEWFFTAVVVKWWFSNTATHSVFVSAQHFTVISAPSFSFFYVCVFSLLVLIHGFLNFQLFIFHYCCIISVLELSQISRGSLFSLFSLLFYVPLLFFVSTALLSRIIGCSRLIVYLNNLFTSTICLP